MTHSGSRAHVQTGTPNWWANTESASQRTKVNIQGDALRQQSTCAKWNPLTGEHPPIPIPAVSDWWHLLPGTTLVRWHCFLPSFAWHHTEHHIVLWKWVQFANQPQKFRSLVFWVLCLLCACWSAVPWLAMLPPGNLREFHDFQRCCKASCLSSDSSCFLLWSQVLRLKISGYLRLCLTLRLWLRKDV